MDDAQLAAVAALADPVRRRAFDAVGAAGEPIGRDDVAQALGIGRTLAAFHLDKLADLGLLEITFARRSGRSGPGAGRPAKLYRHTANDVAVQIPPRSYDDLSILLAEALERSGQDEAAVAVASAAGTAAAKAGVAEPMSELAGRGYEPWQDGDVVRLRNCPFHVVAKEFPPLICGMNLALLSGLAEEAGWGCSATLDPAPGRCCVALTF